MTSQSQALLGPLDRTALLKVLDTDSPGRLDWAVGALHPDPQVRLSLVALAGEDSSTEAVELLNWAIQDECDEVSVHAIEACAALGLVSSSSLLTDIARTEPETDARAVAARAALERLRGSHVDRGTSLAGGPAPEADRGGRLRTEAEAADMRAVSAPGDLGELYVDARPVSWEQVSRFVADVGVTGQSWRPFGSPPADYSGALRIALTRIAEGRGQEPVTLLNWFDACAYAAWRGCRLPGVHELSAAESTPGVGGWASVTGELTASRRLDHRPLVPFAGIDAYRDTADEWTLEGAVFRPGSHLNRLAGRHVLRVGGGVGFRCVHSDVLPL